VEWSGVEWSGVEWKLQTPDSNPVWGVDFNVTNSVTNAPLF
jgi:hypothetical protein